MSCEVSGAWGCTRSTPSYTCSTLFHTLPPQARAASSVPPRCWSSWPKWGPSSPHPAYSCTCLTRCSLAWARQTTCCRAAGEGKLRGSWLGGVIRMCGSFHLKPLCPEHHNPICMCCDMCCPHPQPSQPRPPTCPTPPLHTSAHSTFMEELGDAAEVLGSATHRSLVRQGRTYVCEVCVERRVIDLMTMY